MSVIARPTTRSRAETSLSFFSFLFAEVVAGAATAEEHLEHRLHTLGISIGQRIFPLLHLRERPFRRETTSTNCLQFIASSVWRSLFGKAAEVLATDRADELYLVDRGMVLNRYISVSASEAAEGTMVNCATFAAGIVQGMMQTAGFLTTHVEALFTQAGSAQVDPMNVTFVVRLGGGSRKLG